MKAYPEYKDSGVEYLGQIPSEWTIKPLKHIAEIGPSVPKDLNADLDRLVSFIPMENLGTNGDLDTSIQKHASEVRQGYSFFAEGDVIFAKVTPCFENGKSAIARNLCNGYGFGTTELYVLRPKMVRTKFLFYLISSYIFRLPGASHMLGTGGLKRVSTNYVEYFKSPTPSDIEQKAIANFLDRETSRIDKLIAEKQNFIKLLKEKRQALISHVVTKGLDPNVKMKDSGIEWIGQVPEHWDVKRLKHISPRVGVGLVINPSTYTRDQGVYFIFGGDVKEFGFDLTKTRKIDPKDSENLYQSRLSEGDLVSVRVGYPGITAVVPQELEGANCASVIIIRKGSFNSEWLCAAMNSFVGKEQVSLASYGAAQKQYNVSDAVELWFPVPPNKEQLLISNEISRVNLRINELVCEVNASIELLKEHRTALISAAVTGKIDVRHNNRCLPNRSC